MFLFFVDDPQATQEAAITTEMIINNLPAIFGGAGGVLVVRKIFYKIFNNEVEKMSKMYDIITELGKGVKDIISKVNEMYDNYKDSKELIDKVHENNEKSQKTIDKVHKDIDDVHEIVTDKFERDNIKIPKVHSSLLMLNELIETNKLIKANNESMVEGFEVLKKQGDAITSIAQTFEYTRKDQAQQNKIFVDLIQTTNTLISSLSKK